MQYLLSIIILVFSHVIPILWIDDLCTLDKSLGVYHCSYVMYIINIFTLLSANNAISSIFKNEFMTSFFTYPYFISHVVNLFLFSFLCSSVQWIWIMYLTFAYIHTLNMAYFIVT